jgi:hypothetical protein
MLLAVIKTFLLIFALSLSSALAQFGWEEEPLADPVQAAVDRIDNVFGTPFIEPPSSAYISTFNQRPVTPPPAAPVVPWSGSPVVRAEEALVEQCDLEPAVAQAYRASALSDPTRHSPQVTSHFGEAACPEYLGRLSANPYAADSTANPYSQAGSPYSSTSVNNRFGPYGSPYSATSARNPYATDAPDIVAQDGTYLGKLSDNRYDPDSVANPYGRYGSPYSSTSINNPYSTYGSPYSSQSPNNPYTTQAPLLFGD